MLKRGLIFAIPNAFAESLVGFGDDQGGSVQKIVPSADYAHLPALDLQIEKRGSPRRLAADPNSKKWTPIFEKLSKLMEGSDKGWKAVFPVKNGYILFFDAILDQIEKEGKKTVSTKFKAIFFDNLLKSLQKITKSAIPSVLKKYGSDPILNVCFTFLKTGAKLFLFGGIKQIYVDKNTDYAGVKDPENWVKPLQNTYKGKFEDFSYKIVKKIYPPVFNFVESVPGKIFDMLVKHVVPVKYFAKEIVLSVYLGKTQDVCAKVGKDQCASPTPLCEWNPKTDTCGIRESLVLKTSTDFLSWVFWKIVFKNLINNIKEWFNVDKIFYDNIPYWKPEEGKPVGWANSVAPLAVYLFILEVLSTWAKGSPKEETEEKPEEEGEEKPEEEKPKKEKLEEEGEEEPEEEKPEDGSEK